jgi:hypothetical protein
MILVVFRSKCNRTFYRFSVIFQQYGFTTGDAIFAYVGNHNLLYPAFGGAWILGGIVSSGDVSLDYTSMASQVNIPSFQLCGWFIGYL